MKTGIVGFKFFMKGLHPWILSLILLYPGLTSSQVNYRETYGYDYQWAKNVIGKNTWWSDTLFIHGIDAHFALATVFPELIRYSSVRDYMEIKALEVLYVQYGDDYSDFSVGYFQMKPSFAEQIEADLLGFHLTHKFPGLSQLNADTSNSTEIRKARIIRLKDEYYQLLYLESFLRIMQELYPEIMHLADQEKLAYYSTAYNAGYRMGLDAISAETGKKRFYTGILHAGVKYSYADIALDYFLHKE